ncbi:MAG: hypothetical protein ABI771_02300 [Betaproteobacteria bacterium]
MALNLLKLVSVKSSRCDMPKRTGLLIPGILIVLAHSSPAVSALIEIPRARLETVQRDSGLHQLQGPVKSAYQVISIDRRNNMPPLLATKAVTLDREDFLWTAIGHADVPFVHSPQRNSDGRLHRAGTTRIGEATQDSANHAPESTATEVWAAIIIAFGLIWSQARRKARQRPIRFTSH